MRSICMFWLHHLHALGAAELALRCLQIVEVNTILKFTGHNIYALLVSMSLPQVDPVRHASHAISTIIPFVQALVVFLHAIGWPAKLHRITTWSHGLCAG